MASEILIQNARFYDPASQTGELEESDIFVKNNIIEAVGKNLEHGSTDIENIDATGKVVFPGFMNLHTHSPQTFMRHVPEMQNKRIDEWINIAAGLSRLMDPEAHYHAALVHFAELLLSGVTTSSDMVYLYPQAYSADGIFEATVAAAQDLGIRFHPFRGSISQSQKDGALFPDDVVETTDQIVDRTTQVIERFHDRKRDAMVKVGVGPCTLFTSTPEDYRMAAELAKQYDLNLQTHASESGYEQDYVRERFGLTPIELLQSLGWDGRRSSFVHCIEIDYKDISELVSSDSSVVHCPISNARSPIGQFGIAPITEMLVQGVNIAIGVDGSAGNDSANIVEEMRLVRIMQGAREKSTYLDPKQVFDMATMGGAKALRWEDKLGSIKPGKCADIVIFDIRGSIGNVGAWDEAGSLISCQAIRPDTVIVNGEILVREGHLVKGDEDKIIYEARTKWKKVFDK